LIAFLSLCEQSRWWVLIDFLAFFIAFLSLCEQSRWWVFSDFLALLIDCFSISVRTVMLVGVD
jgi:hypothetical protein